MLQQVLPFLWMSLVAAYQAAHLLLEERPSFQNALNKGAQVYYLAGKAIVQDTMIDFFYRN
jgi:hypothetical protein